MDSSTSMAITLFAFEANSFVISPSPGPTSSTTSPGFTPAVRTIATVIPLSTKKCWPSLLVGEMEYLAKRVLTDLIKEVFDSLFSNMVLAFGVLFVPLLAEIFKSIA